MLFGQNKSKTDIWCWQCANVLYLSLGFWDAVSPSHTRQEGEKVQCRNIDYCIRQSIDSAHYRSRADCSSDIFFPCKMLFNSSDSHSCLCCSAHGWPAPAGLHDNGILVHWNIVRNYRPSSPGFAQTYSIFLRVPPEQVWYFIVFIIFSRCRKKIFIVQLKVGTIYIDFILIIFISHEVSELICIFFFNPLTHSWGE